jgi:hypothetical protein
MLIADVKVNFLKMIILFADFKNDAFNKTLLARIVRGVFG